MKHTDKQETAKKIEQIRKQLNTAVAQLTDTDEWHALLDYMASFHTYSVRNILLIKSQHPTATLVAGFNQWKKQGRQVLKGQKGIKIFGYSSKRVKVDERGHVIQNPTDDDKEEKTVTFYPLLSVFDIDQTGPMPGADVMEITPKKLQGKDETNITPRLVSWLEEQGWNVCYTTIPGNISGYTSHETHTIAIDQTDSEAERTATLLHECAHVILHGSLSKEEYQEHRGMAETEAESVAYVAGKIAGLTIGEGAVHYIASWSESDPATLEQAAENVRKATTTIVKALGIEETR